MSMYDYDMNRVLRLLYLGGVNSVLTEHTDHRAVTACGSSANADRRTLLRR